MFSFLSQEEVSSSHHLTLARQELCSAFYVNWNRLLWALTQAFSTSSQLLFPQPSGKRVETSNFLSQNQTSEKECAHGQTPQKGGMKERGRQRAGKLQTPLWSDAISKMRTQNGTLISRHQQDKVLRSTQCLSLTFYPARQMLPSLWRSTLSLPPEDILIGSSRPAPLTSAGLMEHPRFCDSIISWFFKL